jgi:hypothetical protein
MKWVDAFPQGKGGCRDQSSRVQSNTSIIFLVYLYSEDGIEVRLSYGWVVEQGLWMHREPG